jgi:Uncharacterized conserved protein
MRRIVAFCSGVLIAGVIVVAAVAASGSTQVVAKIDTGAGPCSETGGFGSVWVGVGGAGSLARIDPATNAVTGSVDVGFGPCGVAIGAGSVWVDGYGTSSVIRVDPVRMKVTKRIPMRDQIWDVAYGDASVWATEPNRAYVDRINPKTNRVGRRIHIPKSGPANLRYGGGAVWVGSIFGNRGLPHRRANEPRDERARGPEAALGRGHRQRRVGLEQRLEHGLADQPEDPEGRGDDPRRPGARERGGRLGWHRLRPERRLGHRVAHRPLRRTR